MFRNRFAMRCIFALIGLCVILGGSEPLFAQTVWKVAMVIKRRTNATYKGVTVNGYLSDPDTAAIRTAFETHVPALVRRLSNNQVTWQTYVFDDKEVPITNVVKITNISCGPRPEDSIANWRTELQPWDCVFVYWLNESGPAKLETDQNFGYGPSPYSYGKGYATIAYQPADRWTANSEATETFIHEWLHQLEQYYDGAVYLPRPGPKDSSYLHSAEEHPGYERVGMATDMGFWKKWYQAWLTGTISEPGGFQAGLGPNAWRLGTITENRVVRVAVQNEDQEYPNTQWRGTSWANTNGFMITETGNALTNDGCTLLIAENADDDVKASQVVSVRPYTNYVFSAWVKTQNVRIAQAGGQFGANICLYGQPEASRSITGNTDWTWVSVPFNSGNRSSVELALRIGHHGSTARGRAWFDTVRLVQVP